MPAKQGTLKYVRSGQQTLGCANIQQFCFPKVIVVAANCSCSKWFSGQSAEKKPEPQQTKLKLQSAQSQRHKTSRETNGLSNHAVKSEIDDDSKDVEETNGDVDMHDAQPTNGTDVENDSEDESMLSC
jgi:hypothetical protein